MVYKRSVQSSTGVLPQGRRQHDDDARQPERRARACRRVRVWIPSSDAVSCEHAHQRALPLQHASVPDLEDA